MNTAAAPIEIPIKQRLNDFRTTYLAPVIFVGLICLIGWMWPRCVNPAAYVGEAEAVRANLTSTLPGTLQELRTDTLQPVTNGQCLAVINIIEPSILSEELAAIAADLRVLKNRMDVDKTRNVGTWAQLRHDLLTEKLSLNLARVRLKQAEGELTRERSLFDMKLVGAGSSGTSHGTDFGYDVALRDRNSLKLEIEERGKTVKQIEGDLIKMQSTGIVSVDPTNDAIEKDIAAQQSRLEAISRPLLLRSPMDGFVSVINHHGGERIMAGEVILVVSAARTDRVVGWARQPLTVKPKVGDRVKVRRPEFAQQPVEATIVEVGTQLEPVDPVILPASSDSRHVELGLPFLVNLPKNAHFTPGQMVQISPSSRN